MSFMLTNNYTAAIEALENMSEGSIYVNGDDTSFVITDELMTLPGYDHIITVGSWD